MQVYEADCGMSGERDTAVKNLFQIGNFCFALQCPDDILMPENTMRFQVESGKVMYYYRIKIKDELPKPSGTVLFKRDDLLVYQMGLKEERMMWVPGIDGPYAFYRELGENAAEITVSERWRDRLQSDTIFHSLLAMEKRMLSLDGLILHCAYLEHSGEAILFSAPSETGKSTQAHLWERYRDGSRTINGDRALLQKSGGRWMAHGWPVCGDSGLCNNSAAPVRAIVMLSQGMIIGQSVFILRMHFGRCTDRLP